MRPAAAWVAIRRRHEAGETGQALAVWYGVGHRTIRDRARKEGWRRRDAGVTLNGARDDAVLDLLGAARLAGDRAVAEMLGGAPGQAQLYGRLAEMLARLLARLEGRKAGQPLEDPTEPGRRVAIAFLRECRARDAALARGEPEEDWPKPRLG